MMSRPPLEMGWDRSRGWIDQYDRMLRWHARLVTADGEATLDDGWAYDYWDTAFAFFQNSYHLKDWIKFEHPELGPAAEMFVANDPALAYCADVCNGTKHREVTRGNRQPGHLAAIREYAPWERTGQRFAIIGPDGSQPVLPLASRCVEAWRLFVADQLSESSREPGSTPAHP